MTDNQFYNLVAFCILMENGEGIFDKSPDYILEKFNRYVGKDSDEFKFGLDPINRRKFAAYFQTWKEAQSKEYPIKLAGMLFTKKKYYCSWCEKEVKGFKDRLSAREFRISKMCQECQDKTFK